MTNIEVAKAYMRAVQTGDQPTLGQLLSPDIIWHQPGQNRFSGEHRGVAAVGTMLGEMMQASNGTFAISRTERFMENGSWVAVELAFQGQRDGISLDQSGIDLLRIENDRIVEVRLFSSDQEAEDAFWGR
jgi:ketosteroid isomerase-like protein